LSLWKELSVHFEISRELKKVRGTIACLHQKLTLSEDFEKKKFIGVVSVTF